MAPYSQCCRPASGFRPRNLFAGMCVAWLAAVVPLHAQSAFPSGVVDRQALGWTTGGASAWVTDSAIKLDVWSGRSGDVSDRQDSWIETKLQGPAQISFRWKVSSEERYDTLRFLVDGVELSQISGEVNWAPYSYTISAPGEHVVRFVYTKDFSDTLGADAGWVDLFQAFSGEVSSILNGFPGLSYTPAEGPVWLPDSTVARDGMALRSGDIGDGEVSSFEIVGVPGGQTISYHAKASTESGYDFLRFYIDGVEQTASALSGTTDWIRYSHPLAAGSHALRWAYTKDSSMSLGSDAVWIDSVAFTVAPRVVVQPVGGPAAPGSTLRLSVRGGGGEGTTFTWRKDGVPLVNGGRISGADTTDLVITGVVSMDAGAYTLLMSNSAGVAMSAAAGVTVPSPPVITTPPSSLTVTPGSTATFTVVASGAAPLTYQWRLNGSAIPGANGPSLTRSNVGVADAGNYSVLVSNSDGTVASSAAALVVNAPPVITTQPSGRSLVSGQSATLSVVAISSLQPVTYQWRKDATHLTNGARISGATSAQLTLSGVESVDAGSYTVLVGNSSGTTTSGAAAVTVVPLNVAPTLAAISNVVLLDSSSSRYTNDFNFNTTGGTFYGNSAASNVGGNGCIQLTPAANAKAGGFFLQDISAGRAVSGFSARFRAFAGDGTAPLADGFSFNLMPEDPAVVSYGSAEHGVGTGLSIGFGIYGVASVVLKAGGVEIARTNYQAGNVGTAASMPVVTVDLTSDRKVTVRHNGVLLFDAVSTALSPSPGWRFGWAARTGGLNARQLVDDVSLTVETTQPAQVVNLAGIGDGNGGTQSLTVTATSSNPSLVGNPVVSYASPASTGTISIPQPSANSQGTAVITVKVQDNGGTLSGGIDSVTRQFIVTVSPVNDAPTLDQPANLTLLDRPAAAAGVTNTFLANGSGGTFHGDARWLEVQGNGKIELTPYVTMKAGGYFLNDLSPGAPVTSFRARFRAFSGSEITAPADGFSFNFMGDNPGGVSYASAERGVGSGLSVGFQVYPGPIPPTASLSYNGFVILSTPYRAGNVGTATSMPMVEVVMTSDRKVTVKHNGTVLFNEVPTPCDPQPGWRFGFAARTGGSKAWHLIDDVEVAASTLQLGQIVNLTGLSSGGEAGQTLTVTATSSNPALVPNPAVVYAAGSASGTLVIPTPTANIGGSAVITVRVQDSGGTESGGVNWVERYFTVTAAPVNDAPTLNAIANLAVLDVDGTRSVNLEGISDGDGGVGQTITITATSSHPAIIPNPAVVYTSPVSTGTLQLTPVLGSSGTVTITVLVQDNGGTANGGTNSASRTFTVKVGPVPPTIESGPESQIALSGRTATFAVHASGTGLTYKWFKNGTEIGGATSTNLVLSNVSAASIGTYRVQVFNANTELVYPTAEATLSVVQPPANATVQLTQQASFTNAVSSPGTATLQWLKDGEVIVGATSPTFTIPTTQSGDAAAYSVRVGVGSVSIVTPSAYLRFLGSIPNLFNTGVDSSGKRLVDRAEDTHYSLVSTSPVVGQAIAVVTPGSFPTPPWIAGGTNSAWISPTARLREAGSTAGRFYTYRTEFNLAGMELDTVKIMGQYAADDSVTDVLLNGRSVLTPSGVTSNAFQSFTIQPPFTTGHDQFSRRGNLGTARWVTSKASNLGATYEQGEPQPASAELHGNINSVWWKWTAPINGSTTIATSGSTSIATILAVYTGSYVDQLTLVGLAHSDGATKAVARKVAFNAVAGKEYQICLDGCTNEVGDLQITVECNGFAGADAFASRGDLSNSLPISAKADSSSATGESGEPAASGNPHTVWWKWTSPVTGTVTIDTFGSSFDTLLYAYTGSAIGSLTLVTFNDDAPGRLQSQISLSAVAGTEYQIAVDGYIDNRGDVVLNIALTGSSPAAITEYAAFAPGTNQLDFVVKNTVDSGLDRSLTGLRVEYTSLQGVPIPVEVVAQPTAGLVTYGDRKALSVGVVSASPVTYQWYRDNQIIEGATEATLIYNLVEDQDAGAYTVKISSLNGVRWSSPTVLLVDVPITITQQPQDLAVALAAPAQFAVRFRGNLPLSVQWQHNGVDIPGATNATLTIASAAVAHAGRYAAVVADRDATLTSTEAVLSVVEPPQFVQQPQDFRGVAGRDSLVLRSIVDGSQPLRFRWFLNDIPLAALNAPELNLGLLRDSQEGVYKLIASNLAGAVTSRLAQVSVVLPPSITGTSGNQKAYEGESATFSVDAQGTGSLEYQWYQAGTLVVGETSSTLTLTNLNRGQGGEFSVVVHSPFGDATNHFKLEVFTPPVPVVSTGINMAQEFTLQPGWNAIFLNVQPEANTMEDVFGTLPISSIWRWADPKSGAQFIADQSEAALDTAKWQIYLSTNRVESFQNNLFRVFRHNAYLIHLDTNQPVSFSVVGKPGYQRMRWAADSYTLTGLPVASGAGAPTVGSYLKPSPGHFDSSTGSARGVYRLQPDGSWIALNATNTLNSGEAYWFYTRGASSYLAPLEATFQGLNELVYGVGADTKEVTVHYNDPGDADTSAPSAAFSHLAEDQSLPLQINELDPQQGGLWRDLPNGYPVPYQGLSTRTIRLSAKRERIPGIKYEGLMTITGNGVRHLVPVTVERDEPDVQAQVGQPFNPIGLWLGSVSVTHVSEVNGLTTNYVVTLITNIVNGVTNIVEEPTTEIRNVSVGSRPTPVREPFEMRLMLHAGTNGVCQLLQQVTLLTTEAKQVVEKGTVTETTGGEPVLVSDPSLLSRFKGVALRGREMVGRRFSTPFYPMPNTNGVPFDGQLALGSTLAASWSLPADAPINPFYHKYHPDHDNLDASFKTYKEEAFAVRRTVRLNVPARQGSDTNPGMGQDEIQGTYIETFQGLHRTPITVQGTFQLKRLLPVGALNPATN